MTKTRELRESQEVVCSVCKEKIKGKNLREKLNEFANYHRKQHEVKQ